MADRIIETDQTSELPLQRLVRRGGGNRRTSLAQQISLANIDPEAAAMRRASLAPSATAVAKAKTTGKALAENKHAAAALKLGVNPESFAALAARYEGKVDESAEDDKDTEDVPLFMPEDMRCLALLAEEPLHETMRMFIREHKLMLKCFRLVADDDVRALLLQEMGDDMEDVAFGPTISSPTQGGDQQVAAMLAMELVGCVIQLADPCTIGAHHADTASLHRLLNVSLQRLKLWPLCLSWKRCM